MEIFEWKKNMKIHRKNRKKNVNVFFIFEKRKENFYPKKIVLVFDFVFFFFWKKKWKWMIAEFIYFYFLILFLFLLYFNLFIKRWTSHAILSCDCRHARRSFWRSRLSDVDGLCGQYLYRNSHSTLLGTCCTSGRQNNQIQAPIIIFWRSKAKAYINKQSFFFQIKPFSLIKSKFILMAAAQLSRWATLRRTPRRRPTHWEDSSQKKRK